MKDRYKKILVALDESHEAELVFSKALKIAETYDSGLVIAYIEEQMISYRNQSPLIKELEELAHARLQKKIARARKSGIKAIEVRVDFGNPKEYLAEKIPLEHEIDLIVMGATKVNAASRLFGGSTTAYVVNRAPCTVMVVK